MADRSPEPPRPADRDRLNGWKEIAAHLGKGVRTAQRWEKEYGLPVHRLGREGGEIIIASRRELDAWLLDDAARVGPASQPATAPAPPPPANLTTESAPLASRTPLRRWVTRMSLGLGLLLLGGSAGWQLARMAAAARERVVVTARVEHGALVAYDGMGRVVWRRNDFGFPLMDPESARNPSQAVLVADVDDDGLPEVIMRARSEMRDPRMATYLFDNAGRVRWVLRPERRVQYQGQTLSGPWIPHRLFLTRGPQGTRVHATFVDPSLFPTMVLTVTPEGAIEHEFWSDGYVEAIVMGTRDGRPALFLAATNNETRGAALAVFDGGAARGSMPAADPGYRCGGCPPGAPTEVLTFPQRDVSARFDGTMAVEELFQENDRGLRIQVSEGPKQPDGHLLGAVYYHLGPDLTPRRIEVTIGMLDAHRAMRSDGSLDHDYGPQDVASLLPVRRWDGSGWVEVPPAAELARLVHFPDETPPWTLR